MKRSRTSRNMIVTLNGTSIKKAIMLSFIASRYDISIIRCANFTKT